MLTINRNALLSKELRELAHREYVSSRAWDFSPTIVRNRCAITSKTRAHFKEFGLSRVKFRELAEKAFLSGVRRASW
jgi:small subunit ribosomal protein S14